jgi:hypothetical protein
MTDPTPKPKSRYKRRRTEPADPATQKRRNEHCEARLASQVGRGCSTFFAGRGMATPPIGKTIHNMATPADRRNWASRKNQPSPTAATPEPKEAPLDLNGETIAQLHREIAKAKRRGLLRFAPAPTATAGQTAGDCTADDEGNAPDGSQGQLEGKATPLAGHL